MLFKCPHSNRSPASATYTVCYVRYLYFFFSILYIIKRFRRRRRVQDGGVKRVAALHLLKLGDGGQW